MREIHRMDVRDRVDMDPVFRGLVDLLAEWLMRNPDFTPTELREAAMFAASQVEYLTISRRPFVMNMDNFGNIKSVQEPEAS